MKIVLSSVFFLFILITSCAQEKTEKTSSMMTKRRTASCVPLLTKQHYFVYVDKHTLYPTTGQRFRSASLYTPTGFALVANEKEEYAVIDENGKIVLDFSPSQISFNVVNGLTFYKKEIEYEKKMPAWKWEWNILGGDIKKEQTYHKIEVGVLESKQILLDKDFPYLEDTYYLNILSADEEHVFWNGTLYKIKKGRLDKVENNIVDFLENNHFIKTSGGLFSIYTMDKKKPLQSDLAGAETLSIQHGKQTIMIPEVNKERYIPEVPKLLADSKTGDVYAFPKYEKVFPKEIKKATVAQVDFIKKTSFVYSINNSPYFLLGVFNYDHDVWMYDWRYIDTEGNMVDDLDHTYSFKVFDQVGNLVWPDRKMILPDVFNTEKWKFGKIQSYSGMDDLYLIAIEDQHSIQTKGLWNSHTKTWEIKPEYHEISILDTEKQIYALQKEKDGLYQLYDNKVKHTMGSKAYNSINSDGLVSVKQKTNETLFYYIDIYSGQEYKED